MISPREELEGFVQKIWFSENLDNEESLEFKIFNDCGSTIVLNFAGEILYKVGTTSVLTGKDSVIMGPSNELIRMIFKGPVKSVGIHFYPATGHHFYKCSMDKLSDKFVKTTEENFYGADKLYNDVLKIVNKNDSEAEIVQSLEDNLVEVLNNSKTSSQERLINILKSIHLDHEISLSKISDIFNISIRDIQRLFKTFVGVSPNVYIRLNKVKNAKDKIANNEFESLTKLSMDSGYFDQAHFIRDFKKFMEDTPKKYHKLKN
jgi:AraC-like DNA-binding protein